MVWGGELLKNPCTNYPGMAGLFFVAQGFDRCAGILTILPRYVGEGIILEEKWAMHVPHLQFNISSLSSSLDSCHRSDGGASGSALQTETEAAAIDQSRTLRCRNHPSLNTGSTDRLG